MRFKIDDLEILFPHQTIYPEQFQYISALKRSLDSQGHCILEMPSGTGKTMALLSLTIAYLLKHPQKFEKIVYCSRTIPEMEKTINELKKLIEYYEKENILSSDSFLAIIMSARKNLCINEEILSENSPENIDNQCFSRTSSFARKQIESLSCKYYENFLENFENFSMPNGIYDLDDLRNYGRKSMLCPYFAARRCINQAKVLVYSYAYLLDPRVSSIVSKELPKNSIVIFDEAHNIDNACIEAMSSEITLKLLANAIENIRSLTTEIRHLRDTNIESLNLEYSQMVKKSLKQINLADESPFLQNPTLPQDRIEEAIPGSIKRAESFISTLRRFSEFLRNKFRVQHVIIESPSHFLREIFKEVYIDQKTLSFFQERMVNLLRSLRISDMKNYKPILKITAMATQLATYVEGFVLIFEPFDSKTNLYDPRLNFSCLDASIPIKPVFDYFKSVVVTSGTISPLDMLPKILDFRPNVMESYSMSLARPCICPMVVGFGNDQIAMTSRFESRDDALVIKNYGLLLLEMCKVVPDGIICFFPSYIYMEKLIESWQHSSILDKIQSRKLIFIETPNFSETTIALTQYKKACNNGRGSIFFSVARGKVSEGIDFSHNYGRCVVMIGIPYMYTKSRILLARLEYLRENLLIRESDFLNFDAIRQASQCLGRVLRSKDDYGILCLADQRYSRSDKKTKLPKWINENLKEGYINLTVDDAIHLSRIFLRQMGQKFTIDDQIGISMLKEHQVEEYAQKLKTI